MSAAPDVAVVGAGVVGLCCALALAERGAKVVLLDRGLPGAANSVLTGGGVRRQFGTAANVALSMLAAPFWESFEARFGVDPLFRPIGYLFLAKDQAETAALHADVAMQNGLGVDSEALDGAEIAHRWPALAPLGFTGGAFRQGDGWLNQHRVVDGLLRGALAGGVDLRVGTDVLAVTRRAGRTVGGAA